MVASAMMRFFGVTMLWLAARTVAALDGIRESSGDLGGRGLAVELGYGCHDYFRFRLLVVDVAARRRSTKYMEVRHSRTARPTVVPEREGGCRTPTQERGHGFGKANRSIFGICSKLWQRYVPSSSAKSPGSDLARSAAPRTCPSAAQCALLQT